MRIVLTNFGSTGSVYPSIALATECKRNGHTPILALPPYFQEWVESLDLDFVSIGPDLRRVQNEINQAMVTAPDRSDEFITLLRPVAEALPRMYRELYDGCQGADVLVSGPVQPTGLMVHETMGIPFVTVQNVHYTNGGTPAFQKALCELVNPMRRSLSLPPLQDPIEQANRANLVLFAMSRHIRAPRREWPSHYRMTGYFFLRQDWQPDPQLLGFFKSGEPPIVVTMGSMVHRDADAMTDLILSSIAQVGCRAVIQHGWGELGKRQLPPNVYAVGFVPHEWIFRQASLIVHHGGAGTAASVFRSGVPSVFVPHTWDQPIWAELAREIGCCGEIVPLIQLTADRLARAIRDALSTPDCRIAAEQLGEKIRAENGVRTARMLIEELVSQIGLSDDMRSASDGYAARSHWH